MDGFLAVLIVINTSFCFFFPFMTIAYYKPEPVAAALLLAFSIVWCCKLYSFHHVCFDARRAKA